MFPIANSIFVGLCLVIFKNILKNVKNIKVNTCSSLRSVFILYQPSICLFIYVYHLYKEYLYVSILVLLKMWTDVHETSSGVYLVN